MHPSEPSRIPDLIESRIRRQVEPIARQAARHLRDAIDKHIESIGLQMYSTNAGEFVHRLTESHIEHLVAERIDKLVDDLTAPAPVEAIALDVAASTEFKLGDWVMLKSGGPAMLVTAVDRWLAVATCQWSDVWDVPPAQHDTFPFDALVPAPRSKIPHPQGQ